MDVFEFFYKIEGYDINEAIEKSLNCSIYSSLEEYIDECILFAESENSLLRLYFDYEQYIHDMGCNSEYKKLSSDKFLILQ